MHAFACKTKNENDAKKSTAGNLHSGYSNGTSDGKQVILTTYRCCSRISRG